MHSGRSPTKELSPLFLLCCCSELQAVRRDFYTRARTHPGQGDLPVLSLSCEESEGVKVFAGLALTSHQSLSSLFRGLLQRGSNKLLKCSPPQQGTETLLQGSPQVTHAWGCGGCTSLFI